MENIKIKSVPKYNELIEPAFYALKELDGSGSNSEILNQVIKDLQLPDNIIDQPHGSSKNQTELAYRLAWAKTYLSKAGIISNSSKGVWSICSDYTKTDSINEKEIVSKVQKLFIKKNKPNDEKLPIDDAPLPEEAKPWREKIAQLLHDLNPYAFERLTQRLLRECGFTNVTVTKKSGDGGIDGFGVLKINGIISFNIAFQCKRYEGSVGAPEIRDFRGSLTTDIEKGLFVTTGTFTNVAVQEAATAGKKQIDLIDGEAFIDLLAEHQLGLKPITIYQINEDFFDKI